MANEAYNTIIIAVVTIFIALTTGTTALRLWTRVIALKKAGWEELLMLAATLLLVTNCGAGAGSLKLGLLRHTADIPRKDLIALGNMINIIIFVYIPAIAFTKLSILLQMTRIFIPIPRTKSWWAMMSFITVNMLYYFSDFIATFVACFPRSKNMAHEVPGMCTIWTQHSTFTGVFNVISDFTLLIIPMFWISRLHLTTGKKVVACAVFTVGVLACLSSTTRLVFSIKYTVDTSVDEMESNVKLALCRASEVTAGIICGNLPSFPAFIRHVKGERKTSGMIEVDSPRIEDLQHVYPSHPEKLPEMVFLAEARSEVV
ncbi:hypothetical protein P280DRAFT_503121 [Massarina eburnea CBS 473.64]|uniref:Rhodopsin domain-containing protein n=1 Tax=Massarina eburnea CBS 473.64 TaxID=1395130 RepID=A0A6A6SF88_9PLEO|nr:hypothetical protein P280DRAFT_503121 [Massarina eburnea CBS 473.64]